MPYTSYMQLKDKDNEHIFEMKGWRWDFGQTKELKIHKLKALPTASVANDPIGVDWGATKRDITLTGRIRSNRQLNLIKGYARDDWWSNNPMTLTIGTGATGFSVEGLVSVVHADWNADDGYWNIMLKFVIATVFTI